MQLLIARAESGQERRGVMARDAHDDGRREDQGREQQGSPRPGGHQDGADHDGDRQGQQHLEDLPFVLDRHEGEETAGQDEADGVERAQAPQREPGPAGQQPEHGHGQAGAEVPERHRSAHHGDEWRAADEDQAGEEEEVEPERHEEERLAEQRQALPHEAQPAGAVESPLEKSMSARDGWQGWQRGLGSGLGMGRKMTVAGREARSQSTHARLTRAGPVDTLVFSPPQRPDRVTPAPAVPAALRPRLPRHRFAFQRGCPPGERCTPGGAHPLSRQRPARRPRHRHARLRLGGPLRREALRHAGTRLRRDRGILPARPAPPGPSRRGEWARPDRQGRTPRARALPGLCALPQPRSLPGPK